MIGAHRDIRVLRHHLCLCRENLWGANRRIWVDHLSLEIGVFNDVVINHANCPHAGSGEILQCRRTQPSGADNKDFGILQGLLTRSTNFAQNNMPRIPL